MLLLLSDGKKGHENQSLGLAEELCALLNTTYQLSPLHSPPSITQPPLAILSAGNSTQLPLLKLAHHLHVPSLLIMKPSLLPLPLFTRCLIPEHDLGRRIPQNVIPTKGTLNRIPPIIPPKENRGLIMLGGPSKHFHWDLAPLLPAITRIITSRPDLQWTLGDSRRTPPDCLPAIRALNLPLQITPHQKSGPDWLRNTFLATSEAWLTPDSSSMLSEALTAGCHLGTLPLPPRKTRLSRNHEQLATEGWLTPYSYDISSKKLPAPPHPLHETSRCAKLLLPLFQNPSSSPHP